MLRDKYLFKYEEDNGSNLSGTSVSDAQENVQGAISDVTKAIADAPNKAMEDLLASVKDVLGGVTEQLKRANDIAEKSLPVTPEPSPTPEPIVDVPVPKVPERKVRRGGRKVVKRG